MRITFLGTGTSFGVPVIGCRCRVCASADPRDKRFRSSILVELGQATIAVDAGPEFRLQCLRAGVRSLDLLLLTHAHADHIAGLDDVRPLTHSRILPVYGNAEAVKETRARFAYAFAPLQAGGGLPRFDLRLAPREGIELVPGEGGVAGTDEAGIAGAPGGAVGGIADKPGTPGGAVGGIADKPGAGKAGAARILPIPLMHGILPILGWRIGEFAYLTDCSAIPKSSLPLLRGVRVLVIDGLRLRPHETHFSVDQALAAAATIGASETWLTHINHEASHAELEAYCAENGARVGARPAWDGLVIDLI
jgi:phosphoribosyl 1,2-cyclic phosphate phosphodiesterase